MTNPVRPDPGAFAASPPASIARVYDALAELDCQPRGSGQHFRARCPVHESHGPTLAVDQGQRGALITCHAGCATADVLAALGLDWGDLFDQPRDRPAAGRPARQPGGQVIAYALRVAVLRDEMHARPHGPGLPASERVALAESGGRDDADAHYWRTLARYAALATDEQYVRAAYRARAGGHVTPEQIAVLVTRAEDLERAP